MITVVARIAGFGLRAYRGFGRTAAAGAGLWVGIGTASAYASEASEPEASTAAVRTGIGTLPLLAAMAIGIVIAAIAVIAFLQMTTKAGGRKEPGSEEDVAEDSSESTELPEPSPEAKPADTEMDSVDTDDQAAGLENALPDYTIPLPAMREHSEAAVPAEDGAPLLRGLEGEFAGSGFKLTDGWLTMGRDASQCGLIFPYDAGEVSRKHCSLRFDEGRGLFLLEDHHSSNGTFLSDGVRLEPGVVYELQPGSRFSLSGERHWFEVQI